MDLFEETEEPLDVNPFHQKKRWRFAASVRVPNKEHSILRVQSALCESDEKAVSEKAVSEASVSETDSDAENASERVENASERVETDTETDTDSETDSDSETDCAVVEETEMRSFLEWIRIHLPTQTEPTSTVYFLFHPDHRDHRMFWRTRMAKYNLLHAMDVRFVDLRDYLGVLESNQADPITDSLLEKYRSFPSEKPTPQTGAESVDDWVRIAAGDLPPAPMGSCDELVRSICASQSSDSLEEVILRTVAVF